MTLTTISIIIATIVYVAYNAISLANFGSSYASALSPNVKHRKLFLEEQLTVARLGQLRYWSLMEKVNKNQSDT